MLRHAPGDTYRSASVYANKELSEKAIRSSGLDWTLVYPTLLT